MMAARPRRAASRISTDRREAIAYAFAHAAAGDTVLLAGKATEPSMVFAGGQAVSWDERAVARELLSA